MIGNEDRFFSNGDLRVLQNGKKKVYGSHVYER